MSLPKPHLSLPAPVTHSSHFSSSQSKSHVLAGLQDAYWSDDEAEDADCPLCLEEMDISDTNFKPCPCGYQICRFCWHHIKENLNKRCPACRREYTDDTVEFKPINKDDLKRLTNQKKFRERERKELDALNRRHLLNVRIVQRNVVYVVGLGSKYAKEELISTLRSNEYFGQYGKITKILLVKRTPPGGRAPVLGLYISYYRREDAARAIQAVDGSPSPSGNGDILRASHGTTKYCSAFLRNLSCTHNGCMDLHDWGDEKDCFTKEDLTTLKHTMKDTETRQRTGKKVEESGLPRSAGWGQRAPVTAPQPSIPISTRPTRRGQRPGRSGAVNGDTRLPSTSSKSTLPDRRATKTPSQASLSRPSTPAPGSLPQRPITPAPKQIRPRRENQYPLPPRSPTSSVAVESDIGSSEAISSSPALSAPSVPELPISGSERGSAPTPSLPPGLAAHPPGLVPLRAEDSTLTREPSNSSYQISSQAQALLDDVVNRRESSLPVSSMSPFPDLDRTLQILTGDDDDLGGFSFNLDPKLALDDEQFDTSLPNIDTNSLVGGMYSLDNPFNGFGSQLGPPGLGVSPSARLMRDTYGAPGLERTASASSSYTGSFNPFQESQGSTFLPPARPSPAPQIPQDDDTTRRVSRFGFARERQTSLAMPMSSSSSPLLSAATSLSSLSLVDNPPSATASHSPWPFRQQEYGLPPGLGIPRTGTPSSARGSPLVPHAHAQIPSQAVHPSSYAPATSRFQPFDLGSDEPSLKDLLGIGGDRSHGLQRNAIDVPRSQSRSGSGAFNDPAIMSSVLYNAGAGDNNFNMQVNKGAYSPNLGYGGVPDSRFAHNQPPGLQPRNMANGQLSMPPGAMATSAPLMTSSAGFNANPGHHSPSQPNFASNVLQQSTVSPLREPSPEPVLSAADFPALPIASSDSQATNRHSLTQQPPSSPAVTADDKEKAKLDKKAARKAAAAEKAAERERKAKEKEAEKERLAREKAKEKAEEKARVAKEKAEEKERIAKQKIEKDRLLKEKAEREGRERAEKEKILAQRKAEADKGRNKGEGQVGTKAAQGRASKGRNAPAAEATIVTPSPILSKMPKKVKPVTKPLKVSVVKEDDTIHDSQSGHTSAVSAGETPQLPTAKMPNVSEVSANETDRLPSRSASEGPDVDKTRIKSITEMLAEIDMGKGPNYLDNHPFFDLGKISAASKGPIDYSTMSCALSAFPPGGMSFSENASVRLTAQSVTSFQELLETLTETMSDLVQLLPQTTWGSIFDVLNQGLRDMKREHTLRGAATFDGLVQDDLSDDLDLDDFDLGPPTPTLDKRARWMEIQLAKLEDLHRDVNAAAVRAILANNDRGWDAHSLLPHMNNTLSRFENLGLVDENGQKRPMTQDELEKKLVVAKEAVTFAEAELKEAMRATMAIRS